MRQICRKPLFLLCFFFICSPTSAIPLFVAAPFPLPPVTTNNSSTAWPVPSHSLALVFWFCFVLFFFPPCRSPYFDVSSAARFFFPLLFLSRELTHCALLILMKVSLTHPWSVEAMERGDKKKSGWE